MDKSHEIDAGCVNLKPRLTVQPHPWGEDCAVVGLSCEAGFAPDAVLCFTAPGCEKVCFSPSLDEVVTPDRSALDVLRIELPPETEIFQAILRGAWLDYAYQGVLDL